MENGTDPNLADKNGFSPLVIAINNGRLTTIKLLIDHGADINIQDKMGFTPLTRAIRGYVNLENVVKLLLDSGVDPNLKEKSGLTPLAIAKKLVILSGE